MSSELSEFLLNKARNELRENDERKRQSLEQVREWSFKHPFISISDQSIMTDEMMIPFLRAKKYTMDKVYKSVENVTLFVKSHSNWFDWQGENLKRAMDLYDSGFLFVMKERDCEGRRIVMCRNQLDMEKFNADDVFRLHVLIFSTLQMEEATQIAGAIYINDCSLGINMNYITMFPLKSVYDMATQLKSTPFRLKQIIVVGLPTIASQLLNTIKLAFSDTMKMRLQALSKISEVSNFVDISLLPQEVGGKLPQADSVVALRPSILQTAVKMKNFFNGFDVDFNKVESYKDYNGDEHVGSFRKLNID